MTIFDASEIAADVAKGDQSHPVAGWSGMVSEVFTALMTPSPLLGVALFGAGYLIKQASEAFVRISAERRAWRRPATARRIGDSSFGKARERPSQLLRSKEARHV